MDDGHCSARTSTSSGTSRVRARTGYMGSDLGCGCFFLVAGRRAWCWRVRLSGLPSYSVRGKQCSRLETEPGAIVTSVYGGFQENFVFLVVAACVVRTWKSGTSFPLRFVSGSHAPCFWVLPVECRLDFSGDPVMLLVRKYLVRQWIHVCISCGAFGRIAPIFDEVDSDPEVFHLCSHAEWRSVLSLVAQLALGKLDISFTSFTWLRCVMMDSIFSLLFGVKARRFRVSTSSRRFVNRLSDPSVPFLCGVLSGRFFSTGQG